MNLLEFGRGCAVTDVHFNVRQNLCVPITIVVVTNRGDDLITVVMIYVPESHPQYKDVFNTKICAAHFWGLEARVYSARAAASEGSSVLP